MISIALDDESRENIYWKHQKQGRQKDFYQGGQRKGFFPGWPNLIKFHFTQSSINKTTFLLKVE